MKEIPADLVLESGAALNGFDKKITKPQAIRLHEALGSCRDCHFLEQTEQGNICTFYTAKGRGHTQSILDRQESVDNTVQSLVTRGDVPIRRLPGEAVRYTANCFKNFVTGNFYLPDEEPTTERSPFGINFFSDRRNTPWRHGVRRRD